MSLGTHSFLYSINTTTLKTRFYIFDSSNDLFKSLSGNFFLVRVDINESLFRVFIV